MSDFINLVMGELRRNPQASSFGPALESQRYVERFQQTMIVVEFACAHGTQIDNAYGYFVEVQNERNTQQSRCTIFFCREYVEGVAVFLETVEKVRAFNEYICAATITRQIVPIATSPESGTDIWESTVKQIDEVHALLTTVTATEYATLTSHEWDEQLNAYVTSNKELSQTGGASSVSLVATTATHVFYTQIKCGWYLKTTDTFAATNRTYTTAVDAYWPAVLDGSSATSAFITDAYERNESVGGGANYYTRPNFTKEAYRGPCLATVLEQWALNPHTLTTLQLMQPIPLVLTTPFTSFSVGPTLHAEIDFNITISDDPEFEDVVANYTWPATTPTDWPASVVISDEQNPFRGGYLRRRITVYPPSYA